MREFDLINRYLAPLASEPGAFGLKDDAAVISCEAGEELVVTKDLLVAGTHYLPGDPAGDVAEKLLAVNLSDLAAKGAGPVACLLGLKTGEETDDAWLEAFVSGLKNGLSRYGLALLGGDTVSGKGPAVLSLTAFGTVKKGGMIRRQGARPGDAVYVTGTLGDAALGLKVLRGELPWDDYLAGRYRRPEPRLAAGLALRGVATAAADISDGLLADAGHIAEASAIAIRIFEERLPLSAAARSVLGAYPDLAPCVYAGGDDYEIVFTARPGTSIPEEIGAARIGEAVAGEDVVLVAPDGSVITGTAPGYAHELGKGVG